MKNIEITFRDVHAPSKNKTKAKAKQQHTATVIVNGIALLAWEHGGERTNDKFAALEGMDGAFEEFKKKLELDGQSYSDVIHEAMTLELARRSLRKLVNRNAVFVRDGKICTIKLHNGPASLAEVRTYLKKKYPKAVLLNGLGEAEAMVLYMEHEK